MKLTEALAISRLLEFNLDYIAYSPDERFRISASNMAIAATRARKTLLQAIRYVDQWSNQVDEATEQRLISRLGHEDVIDLYTGILKISPSFKYGGFLGSFEGDNYAVYFNDTDRAVKQAIVDAVNAHILVSEDELMEFAKNPPGVMPGAFLDLALGDPEAPDDGPTT